YSCVNRIQVFYCVTDYKSGITSYLSSTLVRSNAGVFGILLNRAGVPQALGDWLSMLFSVKYTFLLGVNLALFVIGMFIETSASISEEQTSELQSRENLVCRLHIVNKKKTM